MKLLRHIRHVPAACRCNNLLASVLLSLCALAAFAYPAGVDAGKRSSESPPAVKPGVTTADNDVSVGPGKVRFFISREGTWLGLFPSWQPGKSVFERGGFAVFAENRLGQSEVIANSGDPGSGETRAVFWCGDVCEGMPGGCRQPAPNPDDDTDGRIDEDRLDGMDNDGDGKTDEDFKAVGDDMAVVETIVSSADTSIRLLLHQECYAWSLPHIENMVIISLRVKNVGTATLEGVRIGAHIQVSGPLDCSTQTIGNPSAQSGNPAVVLACGDGKQADVALALLAHDGGEKGNWLCGIVHPNEQAAGALMQTKAAGGTLPGGSPEAPAPDATCFVRANEHRVLQGISPAFGSLAPGDEIGIDVALLASKTSEKMQSAIIDAYKTCRGDGTNRFLPPPVSLTRRALWGRFERLEEPHQGILVTIENAGPEGLDPARLSFLSGMPLDQIEIVDASGRDLVFAYRGSIAEDMMDASGRIALKARQDTGELFDVTLRPDDAGRAAAGAGDISRRIAAEFWHHPGKLSDDLLKSSPNPFRESTTIFYEIPAAVNDEGGAEIVCEGPFEASVKVYNVSGQLVGVLADWIMSPGRYTAEWNAIDENGNPVASGVYYVKLQIEKRHITQRMILVR